MLIQTKITVFCTFAVRKIERIMKSQIGSVSECLMTNIIRIVTFSIGMITTTTGGYNIQPWTSLQLDAIPTMMDYNTVIIGPGAFNYSVSYGYEATAIPAICELGKHVVTIIGIDETVVCKVRVCHF